MIDLGRIVLDSSWKRWCSNDQLEDYIVSRRVRMVFCNESSGRWRITLVIRTYGIDMDQQSYFWWVLRG